MKRMLVLTAAVAAVAFVPVTSASAEVCVTNNGQDVVCVAPEQWIATEQVCVTVGGRPVACV